MSKPSVLKRGSTLCTQIPNMYRKFVEGELVLYTLNAHILKK